MDKKENHSRENKHFSEDWYRDRLGTTCKIPYSVVSKGGSMEQEHRKQVYLEWKRNQRAKLFKTVLFYGCIISVSIAVAYAVTVLGFRI
jgi:hypothetical protein